MCVDADERDRQVRWAAFHFLAQLTDRYGDVLPFVELRAGFDFGGLRVPLLGPQGIFKPAVVPEMPLTITTSPPVDGRPPPYEDEIGEDGFLRYRYRGLDAMHRDNVGLRKAFTTQTPLIYLHGIVRGQYIAQWPVYIHADDPARLTFTVAMDDPLALRPDLSPDVVDDARRAYVTRQVRQRVHQLAFRTRVLRAYRDSCTVCRLSHVELLDAAHILSDKHPLGEPHISNGLALCKLHHAAFDRNILGIRPDLKVAIRHDILDEIDGPMLRHGLQDLHGLDLMVLPRRPIERPNAEFLAERYEQFLEAG
jgi:putative restriction endonuclease